MTQAGTIAQYFGAPVAVAAGAVVLVVVALLIFVLNPDLRRLRVGTGERLQPAYAGSRSND